MGEKAYSLLLHVACLNHKDVSERYCVIDASRESAGKWFHKFSKNILCREEV
jgi:hypothetical protein